MTARPLLAATMIVKDEAERLPRALAALAGLVDEVCVYDTGSTDDTVAIARAAGARVVQGSWDDDFGRARNAALGMAHAEWALIVDGDDEVAGDAAAVRAELAALPTAVRLVTVQVVNTDGTGTDAGSLPSVRLARRSGTRWHGRVHETLLVDGRPPVAEEVARFEPGRLVLRHHGYGDPGEAARKRERNIALARRGLADQLGRADPDPEAITRTLVDLGRALAVTDRLDEAAQAFADARSSSAAGPYRAVATTQLGELLLARGGHADDVLRLCDELDDDGLTPPGVRDWLRARAMAERGDLAEAVRLLGRVTELVDAMGMRQSLEIVLLTLVLHAIAIGSIEEAGRAMLDVACGYQATRSNGISLLELWRGREGELASALGAHQGPLALRTGEVLAGLGGQGAQVALLSAGHRLARRRRPAVAR